MAVPVYSTDLTLITEAESPQGWTALGGGGAGLSQGPDYAVQGTYAIDKQVSGNVTKGMMWIHTATTLTADQHVFLWLFPGTPGTMDTYVNGGLRACIGTSSSDYNEYYLHGSDTLPMGGAQCYCVKYDPAVPTIGSQVGTPGTNPSHFGGQLKVTGTVKGANFGIDVLRYGTGGFITAGDVGTPASFSGFSAENDARANRWGICSSEQGVFKLQGRFVIGQTSAGTPTAAYFVAQNDIVTLTKTPQTLSNFTQIIIDHASTVFNLTNVTVIALGTNNPGRLVYNNASTVSSLVGCTFSGLGISTLRAGVTASQCIWRASGQVTTNGATITGSTFNASSDATGAIAVSSPAQMALVTDCNFTSNAKAIKITAAGTYTFNGHLFNGNTVQVDFTGTGTCTINPTNGCNVAQGSCVATGGGTIVVNAVQISFSFNVIPAITGYEWRLYIDDLTSGVLGTTELDGEESAVSSSQVYSYPYTSDQSAVLQILADGYEESLTNITLGSVGQSRSINLVVEENT